MSKIELLANAKLKDAITSAAGTAAEKGFLPKAGLPEFTLEIPSDRLHGDIASNVAMVSAKALRMPPRRIAEAIAGSIDLSGTYFEKCEIAGPGFLNFFYNAKFYTDVLKDIKNCGADYGKSDFGKKKRVMVEYVSANPTGPMHMGNARGGALGDCLASVLGAAGFDVTREFYVNDAGNQIIKFGRSLEARYLMLYKGADAVEFPEDRYQGEDINDRAKEFAAVYGDRYVNEDTEVRQKALVDFTLPKNIEKMRSDLKKYGIVYDNWFLESTLHNDGELDETLKILKEKGMTYEKDGAVWYAAKKYGAEKDEVLVRQNGTPTYFAADIAYHRNKFVKRGFERCIDVWGADHHGHVARMKGAMDAIGLDGSRLDVILVQLVRLVRNGEVVRMSKRTGKAIQLADLLDEVPVDAARFYFNMREANTQMDFDLDLAVRKDSQNPVYYVQYAHARICSIIKKLAEDGIRPRDCTDGELALLTAPEEIELIRHLSVCTSEIIASAKSYDPARMMRYIITAATLFHKFYTACRIKGEDEPLAAARLYLCEDTATVIENVLAMFKISAPEKM
ncbi:MAG TPA: arginine--tRNA ligase [Ruminococcaceae bacterium]|nr:arginine--tRNA ligase [Oscillospiraceae bacterium]